MNRNLLHKAFENFDATNSQDPHKEIFEGKKYLRELLFEKKSEKTPIPKPWKMPCVWYFSSINFSEFMKKTAPEKMPAIIQKTWAKMSEKAKEFALKIPFGSEELKLIQTSLKINGRCFSFQALRYPAGV